MKLSSAVALEVIRHATRLGVERMKWKDQPWRSSWWRNFRHWLHRELLWQFSVQPAMMISSTWRLTMSVIDYALDEATSTSLNLLPVSVLRQVCLRNPTWSSRYRGRSIPRHLVPCLRRSVFHDRCHLAYMRRTFLCCVTASHQHVGRIKSGYW